jgi:hypothetical protein
MNIRKLQPLKSLTKILGPGVIRTYLESLLRTNASLPRGSVTREKYFLTMTPDLLLYWH